MKKLFTFIAALCCTMFFFTARATALSDGAIIYVGLEQMTHEDVDGWTPKGLSSGTITYDETNHVLTLHEVNISKSMEIDASAFYDKEFTIRVEGDAMNIFSVDATNAIRFIAGKGLIIEGEKGTGLSISINNLSGYGGCGIMCATSFSTSMAESDYLPLTIQGGVSVGVNNYSANESKYAAIIAYPITIKSSDLSAATTAGTGIDAVQTGKGVGGVTTTKSQWMNYDEYDNYFWEWKAYSVAYDVWVNGYALTDRRSSLSSSDMTNIKNGSLKYDYENNVLELSGGFELEVHDGWSNGISYDGVEPLTIKINSYSPVTISEKSMSSSKAALYAKGPVIIDLNGCDLELTSTYGTSLWIQDEVTITNSMGFGTPNDAEKKTLTVNSPNGFGIIGDASDAKMTIDRTNVVAGGNKGSVIEIPTTLNNVELESGYHWNSMHSVVDEYDAEVADPMKPVHFNISAWKLTTEVWPEEAGRVDITADGVTYLSKYYFTTDKTVQMKPIANDGWEFLQWEDMNQDVPRELTLLPSWGSEVYKAEFVHLIKSETQWYSVMEVGGKRSIFPINNKLRDLGTPIADLTPTDDHTIVCAAFAEGYLYYIETNSLGTKSWLVKASFDGTTLGTPEILTNDADADSYSFFYNIAYSYRDECFYAYCRRMSDAKVYFVKLSPVDGAITELSDVATGYSIDGLVVDENGILFTFFDSDDLWAVDPTNLMTIMEIGKTDLYLPGSSSTAMFNDPTTGELFVFDDDIFWRVNKTDATIEPVWLMSSLNTNCIFSIESPGTRYTVTVQSADESKGTVSPSGTKKYLENSTLVLTPTPKKGYMFVEWQEDHNTDNPRTVTVTEDKTYTAVFDNDPNFTLYDVFIGDEQFYTGRLTMTKEDNSAIKNSGSVTFDPTTNTLSLNAVEIESTVGGIQIGHDEEMDVTILVNGTCDVKSALMYNGLLLYGKKLSTIKGGTDNPKLTFDNSITISTCDFEISGLTAVVKGSDRSIVGNQTNKLIVTGANLTAKAASTATISNWAAVEYKYCSVTPTDIIETEGNLRIYNDDVCDDSNNQWTGDIVFTPLPKLTVKPVQEGTAHFKLKAGDDEFTDTGFFAKGTKVTITPQPSSNFTFARWTDDADWKDKDLKIPAKREFDMPASDKELEALFYFEPESDENWFGVNNDEFVQFSFGDHAAKVNRASNTLSNVKGGDYVNGNWIYCEDGDFKVFSFGGSIKDGKDVEKIKDYNDKSISGVTDMAYDLVGGNLYAVAGSKLYRITAKEAKEIATFKLDKVETSVVAIAFNADGDMYALGAGAEGVLYTATISGENANLKIVGKKENGGKIGIKVTNNPQSIAFDLSTGELFWGADDYIRLIDTNKMKTFIVGDLDQKAGSQGFIQSLHRAAELVTVTVMIAEGQEDYGTVTVGETSSTKKHAYASEDYVEGASVTITATANEGYYFSHWEIDGDKKHKEYEGETMDITAEDITYVAYFEEGEGIESITIDPNKNIQKVVIDGVLYILRDGNIYTVTGELVK